MGNALGATGGDPGRPSPGSMRRRALLGLAVVVALAGGFWWGTSVAQGPGYPAGDLLARSGQIVGTVLCGDEDGGAAAPGADVSVWVRGRAWTAHTDGAGNFAIDFVPPGDYELAFITSGRRVRATASITVTDSTVADVGTVTVTGGCRCPGTDDGHDDDGHDDGHEDQDLPTSFVALSPVRVLDTRTGNGAPIGPLGHRQAIDVQLAGRAGLPESGVDAVVLNVTVTESAGPSFVTTWPTGTPRPNASTVNTDPGADTPNLTIAKVGEGGKVSFYNNSGATHVVADLVGWFPVPSADTGCGGGGGGH